MSSTMLVVIGVAAFVAIIAVLRGMKKRDAGGYHRRFNGTPIHGSPDPGARHRDDGAFPVASTLYLGDGGSPGHHHSHSADCAHHSDSGAGCPDGGSGGGGGSD